MSNYRKRTTRTERIANNIGVFTGNTVLDFALAWWMMIFLGVAHGFDGRVPAFGYWACFFLIWALGSIVSSVIGAWRISYAVKGTWE